MGEETLDAAAGTGRRKSRRTVVIAVAAAIAVLAGGLGTWFALSRPAGVQRADVVRLDKERAILDNSMNLYDPLFNQFSVRYSSVMSENAEQQEKDQVITKDGERLKRESRTNLDRLDRMAASPAVQEQGIRDAFTSFKDRYSAVISYNDQLVIDTTSINQSIGGPCAPLHSTLNVGAESYSQDYVKGADACLAAIAGAKDKTDAETTELLTSVEGIIRGQRDKQQEVLDGKDDFERLAKRTLAGLAMLDINDALKTAETKYESAMKEKYNQLVGNANDSNKTLESALKERADQFDAAAKDGE
ncbi:hypothetical protein J2Y66_000597 [Paenarthrobacter nitroguajacolicus]|uniref:hypothetical protein n=1 Tax=Paenarthrobacter TaxID=1742992 RepID=UPI00285F9939|nr:hypothetical protein [Paenarthrobacter nitroguajacolicus]MDR6986134.1 hypothetical protein [Paenarthrobacter nitroguajacolicus]